LSLSYLLSFSIPIHLPLTPTLFPYTTLFRSSAGAIWAFVLRSGRSVRKSCRLRWGGRSHCWLSVQSQVCFSDSSPLRCSHSSSRSEEHTSELQSPYDLVCRLLLEKKNNTNN